jgi:Galactose oxidase, central domain/Kelch motif
MGPSSAVLGVKPVLHDFQGAALPQKRSEPGGVMPRNIAMRLLGAALAGVLAAGCGDGGPVLLPGQPVVPQQLPPPTAALNITSGAPPTGYSGYAYDGGSHGFSLTASGGVAPDKWSWAAAAGSSLPPGMSIATNGDSTGTISGIPTANGNYKVVVTVSDSESPVSMVSEAYTITISAPGSLAIGSQSPPSGQDEKLYDDHGRTCSRDHRSCTDLNGFVLSGSGGIAPYTWSWAAGPGSSLPPGLNIVTGPIGIAYNGEVISGSRIAGTPIKPGSYNVVVTCTDSQSPPQRVSANYTIAISPPPPIVIGTVPPPAVGTLNSPYQFNFAVASGGLAPFRWSESGSLPAGLSFSTGGALSGTPTVTGPFKITVRVLDSVGLESAPQDFLIEVSLHGFEPTGGMGTPRTAHAATLLSNGSVLVTGGYSDVGGFATAELYDPNSGTFSPTGSMQTGRFSHTATLLSTLQPNGLKVLVAGGGDGIATAELFDPSSGTFTPTGSMITARWIQTATLLNDGTVLVAGGADTEEQPLASAELYEPSSGTFKATGSMATARFGHTATLLNDGRVLVTGGTGSNGRSIATAELFDPTSGTFTPTGSMNVPRYQHTATLLKGGKVLVTGGTTTTTATATAELYDPSNRTFTATGSMEVPRSFQEAKLLTDGTVLVTGGQDGVSLSNAEVYDSVNGTFTPTGSMGTPRTAFTSTLLHDGAVLVTGGDGATAELYH